MWPIDAIKKRELHKMADENANELREFFAFVGREPRAVLALQGALTSWLRAYDMPLVAGRVDRITTALLSAPGLPLHDAVDLLYDACV